MSESEMIIAAAFKLIGPVMPVGEFHEDAARFENLNNLCALASELLSKIDDVEFEMRNRNEFSCRKSGDKARSFLDGIGSDNCPICNGKVK